MNQLKAGAFLSYINIFIMIIIGFVYTPIMLRLLGQSEYGLYSLIGAFVGYLSVLDLGLGNTLVRYTVQNRIIGDKESEAKLNGMFLSFYLGIGVLTLIIGSILYANLGSMFSATLTVGELTKAKYMTILLILNFALAFPLSIFASFMQAYEKFICLRIFNIIRVILNPVIVLPLLYMGYGSVMMVIVASVLNISCLLVNVYYCFSYLKISFRFGYYKDFPVKEIIAYSFFIFLNVIIDKIYWSTGQFILGNVLGTKEVAIYAVAMQFILMFIMFSTAISGVLLPKVTMMVANKASAQELSSVMIKVGRIQYFIVSYIFVMFVLVGRLFIYLWAGSAYEDAYLIVVMIMLAIMFPLTQNTGITILQAQNRNKFRMTVFIFIAMVNVCISFYLAQQYGGIGCAVSTFFAQILGPVFVMNGYYYYKIHLDIFLFWQNIIKISIPVLVIALIGYGFTQLFIEYTWGNFAAQVCVISAIYFWVMLKFAMNDTEKGLLNQALKKFRLSKI